MEKRSLYMEKIDAKLTQYNAKLAQLKGKAAEVQIDMKLEYLSQMENLEKKRDGFMKKHEQLKTAGEHGWDELKAGTEKAWHELEEAFDKAVAGEHRKILPCGPIPVLQGGRRSPALAACPDILGAARPHR